MYLMETERLLLRKITLDDAAFVLALINDPFYIQNIADRGIRTLEEVEPYIQEKLLSQYEIFGYGLYVVELKNKTPIGLSGFVKRDFLDAVDIGYAFLQEFAGKGYATEAGRAVMRFGKKSLGLKRILGITTEENTGSINVLEKLGLKYEQTIPYPESDEEVLVFGTPKEFFDD